MSATMPIIEITTKARSLMPGVLKKLAEKENLPKLINALSDEDFNDLVFIVNRLCVIEENSSYV